MRHLIAGVVVLIFSSTSWAKLEITKVESAHGMLGPERKTLDFCPLDELFFRYQVSGVKTDADGKTDVEVTMTLANPNGKVVVDQKTPVRRQLSLGANSYPAFAVLAVPEKAPPGEYTFVVKVTDRLASETASFEKKLTCKSTTYQIIVPRFSRDDDGKIPAPAGGILGESIHFKLRVVGFDKSKKKVQTTLTMTILNEVGKATTEKPQIIKAELNNPDEAAKATQVNFNGIIYLNRTGNFTVKFSVEDTIAKQTTTYETPLKVTAP